MRLSTGSCWAAAGCSIIAYFSSSALSWFNPGTAIASGTLVLTFFAECFDVGGANECLWEVASTEARLAAATLLLVGVGTACLAAKLEALCWVSVAFGLAAGSGLELGPGLNEVWFKDTFRSFTGTCFTCAMSFATFGFLRTASFWAFAADGLGIFSGSESGALPRQQSKFNVTLKLLSFSLKSCFEVLRELASFELFGVDWLREHPLEGDAVLCTSLDAFLSGLLVPPTFDLLPPRTTASIILRTISIEQNQCLPKRKVIMTQNWIKKQKLCYEIPRQSDNFRAVVFNLFCTAVHCSNPLQPNEPI